MIESVMIPFAKEPKIPLKEVGKVDIASMEYPKTIEKIAIISPDNTKLFLLKNLPKTSGRNKGLHLVEVDDNFKEKKNGIKFKVCNKGTPLNTKRAIFELADSKLFSLCYISNL